MEGVEKAVFRRREPGALRRIELLPGAGDQPGVLIEFEVPSALKYAEIEVAAREAQRLVMRQPLLAQRFGFGLKALTEDEALGLGEPIFLMEAAFRLWRDWNVGFEDDPEDVDAKPTPARIIRLLEDPVARAAWHIHLTDAASLERSEGNVSGVSPSTSSGGAPNTAVAAKGSTGRARKVSQGRRRAPTAPG